MKRIKIIMSLCILMTGLLLLTNPAAATPSISWGTPTTGVTYNATAGPLIKENNAGVKLETGTTLYATPTGSLTSGSSVASLVNIITPSEPTSAQVKISLKQEVDSEEISANSYYYNDDKIGVSISEKDTGNLIYSYGSDSLRISDNNKEVVDSQTKDNPFGILTVDALGAMPYIFAATLDSSSRFFDAIPDSMVKFQSILTADIIPTGGIASDHCNPPIPEPSALLLLVCGILGLVVFKRKKEIV
ncbi:MAG: PEP-CTERM sorting domain-containing protein [bacterium]